MKLFGSYTSPFVRHVRIVLEQTNSDYSFIETDTAESAEHSPTKKVPYLTHGDIILSDSTSIIRYIREQAGQPFLPTVEDLDLFCMVNTLLDSAINLFLLERSGLGIKQNSYLVRQHQRVQDGIEYLNTLDLTRASLGVDTLLRLQCFLFWITFRKRFSLTGLSNLSSILDQANTDALFSSTAPPSE